MLELVIFIGLQAAGKTSFYHRHFVRSHRLISKDRMKSAKRKSARQEKFLREALASGQSIVLDNTNPTREDRRQAIQLGREHRARIIAYYFHSDVETNLERNRARQRRARVPDVAIRVTARKLSAPSYDEGFDEIWVVRSES